MTLRKLLFFVSILLVSTVAHAETISLSTYYPAPYGAYDKLKLVPRSAITGTCEEGTFFVLEGENTMQYCRDRDSDGTPEWGPLQGVWSRQGSDVFLDEADINDVRVGIGDSTPDATLEVVKTLIGSDVIMVSTTDAGNGDMFVLKEQGNVGINQPDPDAKLTVRGGNNGATSSLKIINSADDTMFFVRDDGKAKIGGQDIDPENTFEVEGNVEIESAGDAQIRVQNSTTGEWFSIGVDSSDGDLFKINAGQTVGENDQFIMDRDGNVIITGTLTIDKGTDPSGEVMVTYVGVGQPGYYATYAP